MPEFGQRRPGVGYVRRPGSYEYVSAAEGHFAKECTFFRVRLGPRVREPVDARHVLCWLPVADLVHDLAHRSQAWALAPLTRQARS